MESLRQERKIKMLVEAKLNLDLDDLVSIIKSLSKDDLELLYMKLSGEEKELNERLQDIEQDRVPLLTKTDVFANV
jgi:hypothetical protein